MTTKATPKKAKAIPADLIGASFDYNHNWNLQIKYYPGDEVEYTVNGIIDHIANISRVTSAGVFWYTYILGKPVKGFIYFDDIRRGIKARALRIAEREARNAAASK